MPLSADNQALLELLLARGQTYEDISSLLDVPEDEVRARARAALTELGGADPDRNVGLTDWVLGQADPIGRADAARHVREDREDHRLAAKLITELRAVAPGADLPKLPSEPSGGRFIRRTTTPEALAPPNRATEPAPSPAVPKESAGSGRLASLGEHRTRLLVAGSAAAVLLVVVILGITGVFGGDDDSAASAGGGSDTTTTSEGPDESIQTVDLAPTGGGDAEGTATFGIASGSQAFVDVDISNLEPAPRGEAYILWLLISDDQGHPLTPFQAEQDGSYSERIPIASFLTQIAARTQAVDVSLSKEEPLLAEVRSAVEEGTPIIPYTGESVMRGEVAATGGGGGGGASP
jgi:hypothetical protein